MQVFQLTVWAYLLMSLVAIQLDAQGNAPDITALRTAAEQGNPRSQNELAFYYMEGIFGLKEDYAEAAKWYRRGAEQGNAGSQFMLGRLYDQGHGGVVPQDYAEAARWYLKAAEQGDTQPQLAIAGMYQNGKGVPQDYAEARRWYREAAEKGDGTAQFSLGMMYYQGQGVTQDYVEAHMWVNLAVAGTPDKVDFGGVDLTKALGVNVRKEMVAVRDLLESKMTAQQITEAQRRAREWKPKNKTK